MKAIAIILALAVSATALNRVAELQLYLIDGGKYAGSMFFYQDNNEDINLFATLLLTWPRDLRLRVTMLGIRIHGNSHTSGPMGVTALPIELFNVTVRELHATFQFKHLSDQLTLAFDPPSPSHISIVDRHIVLYPLEHEWTVGSASTPLAFGTVRRTVYLDLVCTAAISEATGMLSLTQREEQIQLIGKSDCLSHEQYTIVVHKQKNAVTNTQSSLQEIIKLVDVTPCGEGHTFEVTFIVGDNSAGINSLDDILGHTIAFYKNSAAFNDIGYTDITSSSTFGIVE